MVEVPQPTRGDRAVATIRRLLAWLDDADQHSQPVTAGEVRDFLLDADPDGWR